MDFFFPERELPSKFESVVYLSFFSNTKDKVSSLLPSLVLSADLLGHHSGVCSCSVPPGCHGTVCILQVELHQTALAVCYICCCCLYQFHNHHAAESCKYLWHYYSIGLKTVRKDYSSLVLKRVCVTLQQFLMCWLR